MYKIGNLAVTKSPGYTNLLKSIFITIIIIIIIIIILY
jgi:hypothetical protein